MDEPCQRTVAIWIVAIWLFLGALSVLVGVLLMATGDAIEPEIYQKLLQVSDVHWGLSVLIGLLNAAGATLLLLLKRDAFGFVAVSFGLTLLDVIYLKSRGQLHIIFGDPPQFYALPVSLALGGIILYYIWNLRQSGNLK